MTTPKYYDDAVKIAGEHGIPAGIFTSLISQESSWNPKALGKDGDSGLTQLTPAIYRHYKVNPWNPLENLKGGAKFLSDLYKQYGNWRDALSHYNAGGKLTAGRGYADKILALSAAEGVAAAGTGGGSSGGGAWDAVKKKISDVGKLWEKGIPGIAKDTGEFIGNNAGEYVDAKTQAISDAIKERVAGGGLWVLALGFIGLGIWRMINAK